MVESLSNNNPVINSPMELLTKPVQFDRISVAICIILFFATLFGFSVYET